MEKAIIAHLTVIKEYSQLKLVYKKVFTQKTTLAEVIEWGEKFTTDDTAYNGGLYIQEEDNEPPKKKGSKNE